MDAKEEPEWQIKLRDVLKSLPDDYYLAKEEAVKISQGFHEELARSIGPKLNAVLHGLTRRTLDECRLVSSVCNSEMADLHLCIRCPRTGIGTVLLADSRDAGNAVPRFRLQSRGGRGNVLRTYSSRELPELELTGDCSGSHQSHLRDKRSGSRGR